MLLVLKVLVYIGSIITTFAVLMFVNLPKSICAYGSKTLAYYVKKRFVSFSMSFWKEAASFSDIQPHRI